LLTKKRFPLTKWRRLLTKKRFLLTKWCRLLTKKRFLLTKRSLLLTKKRFPLTKRSLLLTKKRFLLTKRCRLLTEKRFLLTGGAVRSPNRARHGRSRPTVRRIINSIGEAPPAPAQYASARSAPPVQLKLKIRPIGRAGHAASA